MPTRLRLKLLMQPVTDTDETPCTQVSKRLILKSKLPDEDSVSTAFNAVLYTQPPTSLTQVLNSVIEAHRELAQTQKNIGQHITQIDKTVRQVSPDGTNRGRRNSNNRINFGQQYNHNYSPGTWTNYRHSFPRSQYSSTRGQTYRARFNAVKCRICGQTGHMHYDCLLRQPAQRGESIPFNYYGGNLVQKLAQPQSDTILSSIITTNRTLSIQLHGDKLHYIQLSFPKFYIEALVDTGTFSGALPLKLFQLIQKQAPE